MRVTRIILTLVFFIVIAGFYSLYNYLDRGLEAQTLQATEESMVDQVHLLSAIIENDMKDGRVDISSVESGFTTAKNHRFEAKIYKKLKDQIGTNFYVTDATGIVIYDSAHPEWIGADFSPYLDVMLTLRGEYGARSTRTIKTDPNTSTMFVAAPITHAGKIVGIISLYKPQSDVASFIAGRRQWIITSLWLIGFGICSFTLAVFVWLFRPLGLLTSYARGIRDGKRPTFPQLGKGREVNTLGNALKEMRESLEGREYLENYVQMLTHELKSPLSAIKGAAELLDEDMPRKHREKFLSNIRLETERSQHIIDGLLKLSKLESMAQLDTNEHLELPDILHQVINDHQSLLDQKQLKIAPNTSNLHTCHGDYISIIAALSNIFQNAIQFSPSESTISVTTSCSDKHTLITICDQGPGIPDYAIERVFENFYSIARPGTDKKSSGLGLAFVREVANLHDGYATLSNSENGGAIATLALKK